MIDVYRIEKARYPVIVLLCGGERLSGDMFVQEHASTHGGPEWPLDILNDAEPFFPLETEDGEMLLVAKDRVTEVETAIVPDDDPERAAVARPAVVEIRMADGGVRSGAIYLEVPSERPRLLDYLNRQHQRFLTLLSTEGARFLNRRRIECVRPLD